MGAGSCGFLRVPASRWQIPSIRPSAAVTISYGIPTYTLGSRRLYVGVWKHGLSVYGWDAGREAGFTARHPELRSSKGTIKISPAAAATIGGDKIRDLAHAALDP